MGRSGQDQIEIYNSLSYADMRVQNLMEAKSVTRNSKYMGQPKEVKDGSEDPG